MQPCPTKEKTAGTIGFGPFGFDVVPAVGRPCDGAVSGDNLKPKLSQSAESGMSLLAFVAAFITIATLTLI